MKKRVRDLLLLRLSDLELWFIFLTQSICRSSTITFITPSLLTGEIHALLICTNFKMCRKNIRLKNSNERIWYFLAERPTYFQKSITHPVEFFSLKGSPSVCDFSFGVIDLNIDNLFCSGYSVISNRVYSSTMLGNSMLLEL